MNKKKLFFISIIAFLSFVPKEGVVSSRLEEVSIKDAIERSNGIYIIKTAKDPTVQTKIKGLSTTQTMIIAEVVEIVSPVEFISTEKSGVLLPKELRKTIKPSREPVVGTIIGIVDQDSIHRSLQYEQGLRKIYLIQTIKDGVAAVDPEKEYILLASEYFSKSNIVYGAMEFGLIEKNRKNLKAVYKHAKQQ